MKLTVLGKSPSWQDVGAACSSYLVQEDATALLVDCGSGALGKLRERLDYRDLDAIVISHFHADHLLDLVPLCCALRYGPASADGTNPPRLHAPPGAQRFFDGLSAAIGSEGLITGTLPLAEYGPGAELAVGPITVRPHAVPHVGPTHAIELLAPSGGRIVYGADGPASDELTVAARGADLLIAEATLPDPEPGQRIHMSAVEAGRLARAAGVGRLVLTHVSDELDLDRARELAAGAFGGPVEIAAEGSNWEV